MEECRGSTIAADLSGTRTSARLTDAILVDERSGEREVGEAGHQNSLPLEKIGEDETKATRGGVASVTLKAPVQPWLNQQRLRGVLDHYL